MFLESCAFIFDKYRAMRAHCVNDVRFANNPEVQAMLARHDQASAALNERLMKRRQMYSQRTKQQRAQQPK